MKGYFYTSALIHGVLLVGLTMLGTLLAKPAKKYYSIDLMGSMSSGGGTMESPAVAPAAAKPLAVPAANKIKVTKAPPAPAPVRTVEQDEPADDTMKLLAKLKKKRVAQAKQREQEYGNESERSTGSSSEETASSNAGAGKGGGGGLGTGPGISVGNGNPFPFPWYIKAIYAKLDSKWRPPSTYDPGTSCVVSFKIARSGQISGVRMTKTSHDSFFDGIAMQAVTGANPMQPLPEGYPEDVLDVHMTFLGK